MTLAATLHLWLRRHRRIAALLVLAAAAGAIGLAQRFHWQDDVTRGGRHTLSAASRQVLREIPGPLEVTAYVSQRDAQRGDLRQPIREFVARYRYLKPDLALRFVDPGVDPAAAAQAGVGADGELVLSYRGRSTHLVALNERSFTEALLRLARRSLRTVTFVAGQGERSPFGAAPRDLSDFARQLGNQGFRPVTLNLPAAEEVPPTVGVLVLTQPKNEVSRAEADKLERYVAHGGALLWLAEPGEPRGLRGLAEALNLDLKPGAVIDPAARALGYPPATAISSRYPAHPITARFEQATIFPRTCAIAFNDNPGWRATPLVEAAPAGWLADGDAPEAVRRASGPFAVAVALERDGNDGGQRVAVVGGADFLSNAFLGKGGNLDFGIAVLNWLAGDANLIAIRPKPTLDATLDLTRRSATALAFAFLLALPLAFFGAAALVARRRNRS